MEHVEEQNPGAEPPPAADATEKGAGFDRRKVKQVLSVGGAFALALLLGLFVAFLSERAKLQGRVARGVTVQGVAIEGLARSDLLRTIASFERQYENRPVTLKARGKILETTSRALGFRLKSTALIDRALTEGHRGSLATQFFAFARSLFVETTLSPELSFDETELSRTLATWTPSFLTPPVEPSLSYVDKLHVRYAEPGETANFAALRKSVEADLLASPSAITLELPIIYSEPLLDKKAVDAHASKARYLLSAPIRIVHEGSELETEIKVRELGAAFSAQLQQESREIFISLDSEKLRTSMRSFLAEVERPVVEASFDVDSRGQVKTVASEPGVKVDDAVLVQRILALATNQARVVQLPTVSLAPTLSTDQAEALGITGLVSSFTTHHACCQPRVDNIHAVAGKIDGVIVAPGQTFSLNQFLGPRIGNSDYKSAPTIVHGEMQETTGGGISQFATTFFNALLDGGYAIVQRQPHSFYFSRYPEGHEATISFPEPDLIFKNDTEAGVLIKTHFTGTFIKVLLYGNNGGRQSFRHKSKRYNYVKPPTEYEADPEMDPEEQKRLYAGQIGWSVIVSRTIRFPDKTEKKEQREVVYNPRPEVIRTHPCNIPEGEKGHTGEKCPEPEREEREEDLSEEEYFDTLPSDGTSTNDTEQAEEGE